MEFTRILRLHGLRPKHERRIYKKKHPLLRTALLVMTAAALLCVSALAVEDGAPTNSMYGTFWALVPPVIAITLALITKEAYSSLFIGVTVGALFSQGFSPIGALNMIVNDGLVAAIKDNAGIFLFLVLLGIIVALVNAAGGSAAFGRWASKNIKTKVGASLATFLLGILIFIFPPLYGEGYEGFTSLMHGDTRSLFNTSLFYRFSDIDWVVILYVAAIMFFKVVAMKNMIAAT